MRSFLAGLGLAIVVAGCFAAPPVGSTPLPSPGPSVVDCSGAPGDPCVASIAADPYVLTLTIDRGGWSSADAITGSAVISDPAGEVPTLYGSGSSLIGFSFDEVGGPHSMGAVFTADCAPHQARNSVFRESLIKSGGFSAGDPDVAWKQAFVADPVVHLTPGVWEITAQTDLSLEPDCGGDQYRLQVTVRIAVQD